MFDDKVSVVTTVFNGSNHFDKAIPSILSQTHTNFEWIIVDDGSTDGTLERLNELASNDGRIRVLSKGKMGRTVALNYAISQSTTDFIFQQDFDDISAKNRLELQLKHLKENVKVGLVGGYYEIFNEIRDESFIRKPPLNFCQIKHAMAKYIPICHTIAAFRKEAWKDAGGYDESFNDIIDLRFYISLIDSGWQASNLPYNLGVHFVYSESNYIKANKYSVRQRNFRSLNIKAIRTFNLPAYNYLFVAGRYFYYLLPHSIKRFIRRTLKISQETPI